MGVLRVLRRSGEKVCGDWFRRRLSGTVMRHLRGGLTLEVALLAAGVMSAATLGLLVAFARAAHALTTRIPGAVSLTVPIATVTSTTQANLMVAAAAVVKTMRDGVRSGPRDGNR